MCGSFSFVLVHETSWCPRGAQTKNQKRNRPRNSQKQIVLRNLYDGIEALDPPYAICYMLYAICYMQYITYYMLP